MVQLFFRAFRTSIRVKPRRFWPRHLLMSKRSFSFTRMPHAQITSLWAHSTR